MMLSRLLLLEGELRVLAGTDPSGCAHDFHAFLNTKNGRELVASLLVREGRRHQGITDPVEGEGSVAGDGSVAAPSTAAAAAAAQVPTVQHMCTGSFLMGLLTVSVRPLFCRRRTRCVGRPWTP